MAKERPTDSDPKYRSYVSQYTIERSDESSFLCTYVSVEDEGGGKFLVIRQNDASLREGEIRLDFEELDEIHKVAGRLGLSE